MTGLTDALMDSIPVVCLTGQVPSHLIGTDAFQEADTSGITRPATKYNYLIKDSEALQGAVEEAFMLLEQGVWSCGYRFAKRYLDVRCAVQRKNGKTRSSAPL